MASGKKPKQQVADYLLSIHAGICHLADKVTRIRYNEKTIWKGSANQNSVTPINLPGLFGGPKSEGGVRGRVHVLMGDSAQLLSSELASRLGSTPDQIPGFRGMTSLFFTGGGPESAAGFMWSSNSGYIRAIDATVQRSPKGFYPEKAMLPRLPTPPFATQGYAFLSVIDPSGSSSSLNPANTSSPTWGQNFSQTIAKGAFDYSSGSARRRTSRNTTSNTTWYVWDQPGLAKSIPFDPGLTFSAFFSAQDGMEWTGYNIFDPPRANQNPAFVEGNMPAMKVRAVGVNGVVYAEVDLFTVLAPGLGRDKPRKSLQVRVRTSAGFDNTSPVPNTNPSYFGNISVRYNNATGNLEVTGQSQTDNPSIPFIIAAQVAVDRALLNRIEVNVSSRKVYSDSPGGGTGSTATLFLDNYVPIGEVMDANPAHIIYECLTNTDWGLGLADSMIDTNSFITAADTLYAEGFGLSMIWSTQTTIENFINDVLNHIDGTYGIRPSTGKLYLKLIRADYVIGDAPLIDESNSRITRMQRKAIDETTNEIVVTWTNPENEKEQTVTVHDLGNFSQQGSIVSNSSNYYGIRYKELALRAAMRDLSRAAYPIMSFEIEADRSAFNLVPGDVIRVSSAEYGIQELAVRLTSIDYGRPGSMKVSLSGVEDVFYLPTGAYVDSGSEWVPEEENPPADFINFRAGSVPYYFISLNSGSAVASAVEETQTYGLFLAAKDFPNVLSYDLYAQSANALGNAVYTQQATLLPVSSTTLTASLGLEVVSNPTVASIGGAKVGGFAFIGADVDSQSEIALVTSVSPLTLRRGVLDTYPRAWPAGTRLWFVDVEDELSDFVLRLAGATGTFKALPRTTSGVMDIEYSVARQFTFPSRIALPYRAANVRIQGMLWPAMVEGALTVSWARRNRLLEEPEVIAWDAADRAPEAGTTFDVNLYNETTGALLVSQTGVSTNSATLSTSYNGTVRLELLTKRSGLEALQKYEHIFEYTPTEFRVTESGEFRVTESGEFRVTD